MDKALAYRRDIDRREAGHRAQTEHCLERRRTPHRQDAAIRAAMAAIDAVGPFGNGDGVALPYGDSSGGSYVATTSRARTAASVAETNQWPIG
jgi:hypothetical protein